LGPSSSSNPEPQCFTDIEGFRDNGTSFRTSRAGGIPDSLRLYWSHQQQCFRFAISLGCNSNEGGYFDNMTMAFVDVPGTPGQASADNAVTLGAVSTDIWQSVNDTFPANETPGLPGTTAFDTTTALIRTGINTTQATGNTSRFDIPGDSSCVSASNATTGSADDPALQTVRVDLVFRILPGPGNYQVAAGRIMPPGGVPNGALLQLPTNQAAVAVAATRRSGASTWRTRARLGRRARWTGRLEPAGVEQLPDGHASVEHLPGRRRGGHRHRSDAGPVHDDDPRGGPQVRHAGREQVLVLRARHDEGGDQLASGNNVSCNGTVPAWLATVPHSRTGWNGSNVTKEFTKIIPDGLLTPGSHVQYFYRKSHSIDPFLNYAMTPDTNLITPQTRESSTDMHRWQQFSVLPDRWKNATFGGAGSACMLYVDLNDRRGNEGRFVSVMDTIGGTSSAKLGAHNGWHAPGNVNVNGLDVRTNMSVAVSNKNSQPGTTWDMYGVKASESLTTSAGGLGSRLANRANMGFAAGRESKAGPTPEMLRTYYRLVAILSGDLNSGILGPFVNRSQNDVALLDDYLTAAGGTPQPRGIFVQGDGFGTSENATSGVVASHGLFLTTGWD
jgi:hypothetical protein